MPKQEILNVAEAARYCFLRSDNCSTTCPRYFLVADIRMQQSDCQSGLLFRCAELLNHTAKQDAASDSCTCGSERKQSGVRVEEMQKSLDAITQEVEQLQKGINKLKEG